MIQQFHAGTRRKLCKIKCCFYKTSVGGFCYINSMKMTFINPSGEEEAIESKNFAMHEKVPNI